MNAGFVVLLAVFAGNTAAAPEGDCSFLEGYSVIANMGGSFIQAPYNGSSIDLFSISRIPPFSMSRFKTVYFVMGDDNQAYLLMSKAPIWHKTLAVPDISENVIIESVSRLNITKYLQEGGRNPPTEEVGNVTKILRPGNLGFYGDVIYNKGKKWFYVKVRAMTIDTDDDNRNWGKVMDPVDGKIYENEFTNKEGEVKLISVVGGKRVYRRFCDNLMSKNIRFTYLLLHKSNNVTKYRNMKIKDPENLFCFFFENCEIAYSPVGAFNQVLVVPKVPIREPEPVSTSTATSTAAESFAHSSSSTETVSTTVSTQEVTSPSVSKTAATQETTTPKFSLLASTAFIIGVSVALVLLVVAIAVSCIVCRRRKKRKRSPSESTSATQVSSNVESGLALNDSKTSLVEAVTQQSSVIPGAQQPSLMKTQQPSLMKQTALQPLRRRSSIIQATQKNSLLDATTQMETAAQTPVKQSSSVLQAMHQSSKEKLA